MSDENEEKSKGYLVNVGRKRSPGYPNMGLDRAIELARRIYDQAFDSTVDSTTMMQLMGYQGASGASRSAVAALKHYNLIEGRDQDLRLSSLAKTVLQPLSQEEEAEAITQAAWTPEIFAELRGKFSVKFPPDEVLKAYLVRQHDFGPSGADAVIKSLRDTREYLGRYTSTSREIENQSGERELLEQRMSTGHPSASHAVPPDVRSRDSSSQQSEVLTFRVSSEAVATVSFVGKVTQEAIERLRQYLELAKDSYPPSP